MSDDNRFHFMGLSWYRRESLRGIVIDLNGFSYGRNYGGNLDARLNNLSNIIRDNGYGKRCNRKMFLINDEKCLMLLMMMDL